MRSSFRPAVLVLAIVALLALAPAGAMAKGGTGGGGDASCAKFTSYALTTGSYDATRAALVIDYSVAYSCLDENWPPISFVVKDESTGQSSTYISFGPILPGMHEQVFAAAYATKYTVTTTLTQATSGAVYDQRKDTVTTGPAPTV